MSLIHNAKAFGQAKNIHIPSFLTDGLRYSPSSLVVALLGVLSSAVFTRLFVPSTYGLVTVVLAVSGPLVAVLTQPLAQPVGRFFAEYKSQNQLGVYRSALSYLLNFTMLLALIVDGIGFLILQIVGVPSRYTPWLIGGAMALFFVQSVGSVVEPVLQASFQIVAYQWITIGKVLLGFILPLLGMMFFGRQIAWLLWGPVISVVIFMPLLFKRGGLQLRWWRSTTPWTATRPVIWRFLRYGSPMALWFFASSLLGVGDRYVIQAVDGSAAVAIYGVSYSLATQAVGIITGPYMAGCWPRILQQWTGRDTNLLRNALREMTDFYLVIGIALVGGVAVVGHPLLRILVGHAFANGYRILVPVAAGTVLVGASRLGHKSMELVERNGVMVGDALLAAGLNLILNLWAIPRWGFVAAGYTTLASYAIYLGLIWWQSRNFIPWDFPWQRVVLYSFEATIAWGLGHSISRWASSIALVEVFVGGTMFIIIYLALFVIHRRYLMKAGT